MVKVDLVLFFTLQKSKISFHLSFCAFGLQAWANLSCLSVWLKVLLKHFIL